jgi:hypothetical protein
MPPFGDRSPNPFPCPASAVLAGFGTFRGTILGPTLGGALCALLAAGCSGPTTYVENPDSNPFYVDGRAESRTELPFRYYGTSQIDMVPADGPRGPDFGRRTERRAVAMPLPASPWLFPLDFPIELVSWLFAGQTEPTVTIEPPQIAPKDRVSADYKPVGLELVTERALQARISR